MAKEVLTDAAVKNKKGPERGRIEVNDGGYTGRGSLHLRVGAHDSKSWTIVYRYNGRLRRLDLGAYPEVSLAGARVKAAEAVLVIEAGIDPAERVQLVKVQEKAALTVEDLSSQFIELYSKKRKRSWAEDQRILQRDVVPTLGALKAKDLTRRDIARLLDSVAARGAPIAANRTLAVVRKMMNWALDRGEVTINPAAGVAAPSKERSRDRVLTDEEIKAFWCGLDSAHMDTVTRQALRFMLVTGQRLGEVCAMRWEQINSVWTIPAENAKNGKAHRVPLSGLALTILDQAKAVTTGALVFPSPRGDRPMSPTALSHALRKNLELLGITDAHPHDLRRTAASHMTMLGHNRLVVSKVLNHVEGGVTAVYDRYQYDTEKRQALNDWASKIKQLIYPSSQDKDVTDDGFKIDMSIFANIAK
jgi:integrase